MGTPQRTPKSLLAVTNPERFQPFKGLSNKEEFEERWRTNQAWVLSNMSHTAYLPKEKISRIMKKLGAVDGAVYDREGSQAFLAVWPDKAILAFRGTQPTEKKRLPSGPLNDIHTFIECVLKIDLPDEYMPLLANDVLADLMFRVTDLGQAEVHRGFLRELNKLWPTLILQDLHALPNIPVTVTGHSLGGAMAVIAGMRKTFHQVVTFGEPRVGRNIASEFKANKHIRYVNGDDPVTKVPPRWWPFSYEHHGRMKKVVDPDGPNAIFDHSIIYYSENLA